MLVPTHRARRCRWIIRLYGHATKTPNSGNGKQRRAAASGWAAEVAAATVSSSPSAWSSAARFREDARARGPYGSAPDDAAFSAAETAGCGPLPQVCPGDEIAVAAGSFALTFSNGSGVTGTFTPEIVAIENVDAAGNGDGTASQTAVNVLFSIRGADVAPLTQGATVISLLVEGTTVATRTVVGDSSENDAQGVAGFDTIDTVTGFVTSVANQTGVADNRGRIRLSGVCAVGTASAPGLDCRTNGDGAYRCRRRSLTTGTQITVTCEGAAEASVGTPAGGAAASSVSGTASSRGRVTLRGDCAVGEEASLEGGRCRTRRNGSFRCSGSDFAPNAVVTATCN